MTKIIAPYHPLEWQRAPLLDKSPIVLLTGSAGGGKSRVAAEKIHAYCQHYPGATWLIMRKAREWTGHSIIPFYRETVVGNDPRVRFSKSEGAFYYQNGSTVYSGGMMDDKQREAVRSIGGAGGLDGAWLEEANAFTRKDYDELLARIRHQAAPWRQVILTTNPAGSKHWIYSDLIKGGQASVYYSKASDNPNNPADYQATLAKLTGVMYKRLVLGQWVQSEGAVYDGFDFSQHVTERQDSDFAQWALAMDEGYTNPAVILLVGIDNDGRWHIAREFYRRGVLQSEVVTTARQWCDEKQINLVAVDAAAAGLIADLVSNGVPARAAKGRVLDGIRTIQDRLIIQGDGKPRLTIHPACTNLIAEFESYTWKPEKDEPVKDNDHALDSLRYLADALGNSPSWFML